MEPKESKKAITPETIENWKRKHPRGVFELTVEDKKGYVRKPTREEMKYAMTFAQKNDTLGMAEEILKACWLDGDQELIEDDDYFLSAVMQLQELIEIKFGELKKL